MGCSMVPSDKGCMVFMREHWLILMQCVWALVSIDAGCMEILGMTIQSENSWDDLISSGNS